MAQLYGVDISEFQGQPNWDALNNAANFVIIRSSFGTVRKDNQFTRNQAEARRVRASAGPLGIGYYHFAYPTYNSAVNEANFFADSVGALQSGEILVLDLEGEVGNDPVGWAKVFLDQVQVRTGVKPLIYLNQALQKSYNWTPLINANYGLWLAQYDGAKTAGTVDTQWPMVAIKQWTDATTVAGLNGNVDGDTFYGTFDQWYAYGFKNQAPQPAPQPIPPATPGGSQDDINRAIDRIKWAQANHDTLKLTSAQTDNLDDTAHNLVNTLDARNKDTDSLRTQLAPLQEQQKADGQQISDLHTQITNQQNEIKSLNDSITQLKKERDDTQVELVKEKQNSANYLEQLKKVTTDDENLGARYLDISHANTDLYNNLNALYISLGVSTQADAIISLNKLKMPLKPVLKQHAKLLEQLANLSKQLAKTKIQPSTIEKAIGVFKQVVNKLLRKT